MKKASFTIEFDGEDVSATWGKRLVSATVTDNEPGTLDTLVLVFSNAGKAFDPVFPETVISFSLGYAGEPLRDFGTFRAHKTKMSFPLKEITLEATALQRGAGSAQTEQEFFKEKRTAEWRDAKTIGNIVASIAEICGLEHFVSSSLRERPLPPSCEVQKDETFGALLDRLCSIVGASLKFSSAKLWLYTEEDIDAATADSVRINLERLSSAEFSVARAEQYRAVSAKWHDVQSAQLFIVKTGNETPCKELTNEYSSETEARSAAQAELKKIRASAKTGTLRGEAVMDIAAERKLIVEGNFSPFAGDAWRVRKAVFELSAEKGLSMQISLGA